ncbi:hypothetical protein SADUNF_Sadunf14G0116800 [Salix dunnii]|uniref:S-acyltransferase n=1 Tax=Salix dunnii TaxID=1413687 RepID=A0A835JE51_9ROSI|nr:hypothetical protein SADUNF_Sadunf14G0116800 [Salix dunnii]
MKGLLNISQVEGIDDEEDFEMEPVALSCSQPAQQSGHALHRDNDTEKRTQVIQSDEAMKLARFMDTIRKSFVAVQSFAEDLWLRQYGCADNPDITRVYQVFFFHGRLICGPDPRGLLLTTVSIILSSWVFAMYREDDLPHDSTVITAFSLILTVTVLVNLFLVSTIDPGIIPRNDGSCIEETAGTSDGARRMRVTVNGVELKLKYCRVSLIFFVYVFAFSCRRIHQRMLRTGTGLLGMLKNCPETLALVSFSFPTIFFLGGLTILHVFLLARNQTGYENFRQSYMGSQNPFDKGMPSNIREVLFEPLPPSRVDFRAERPHVTCGHNQRAGMLAAKVRLRLAFMKAH